MAPRYVAAAVAVAMIALVAGVPGSDACTKEEFLAKFGAEPVYKLHAKGVEPVLVEDGHGAAFVRATVSYESPCLEGGSAFEAASHPYGDDDEEEDAVDANAPAFNVLFLRRGEPQCGEAGALPDGATATWHGVVEAAAPSGLVKPSDMQMLAFPPDSDYELFLLRHPVAEAEVHSGSPASWGMEATEAAGDAEARALAEADAATAAASRANESAAAPGSGGAQVGVDNNSAAAAAAAAAASAPASQL